MGVVKVMKEEKANFAKYLAEGKTQCLSWKLSHPDSVAGPKTISVKACNLAKDPEVMERVEEITRNMTVPQIDTVGNHYIRMLGDRADAKKAENHTAVAAMNRLIAQCLGMVSDKVKLTVEQELTDDELIAKIANGDPIVVAALKEKLGQDGFEH